ncbi:MULTISPECIES: universal stress protein [Mycobacterium]|uniref:Universal stress protein n=3 Tax=Mycobacterium kiyosense TaxID=2871094 RepID=A0A9P3Q6B1_9MYCO|nr:MULTISPECIES: universal stress protein [Mycobacterium]BDE14843.1 universal stress protein [Mycobacterium sp. 20KCMC460]GLB82217.1 universal stress protein [Mycobacterium kiyosense]GLB89267.1 universal stress protein [Mycobacterium kiyosense]GLB95921.1 universal stress protein [Mycobacterium kiyosense]GLC01489.1 universal stress protein [Mycobacterium kiyosense]
MNASVQRRGVVVGVDGSAPSNAAVVWAARDAALRNVPLHLVHMFKSYVATFPQIPMAGGAAVWQDDDGRLILEEAVKLARESASSPIEITSEVKVSPPVPTMVELSEEAELVVVGSNGRGLVGRVLLGSVSSGVLRSAKSPVVVVRDDAPAVGEDAPVVVGIDGSEASELATAIAFDEASRRGVDLKAVHAWSDAEVLDFTGIDWEALQTEAEQILAERLAGWQERYPDVTVHRIVVRDRPAQELIEQAKSAQLLVVGSHGRGAIGKLLGSVSNAVVHSVHTPVIVARPA